MTTEPALVLYHAAPSRSSIVRWLLEEIGEPYEIRLLRLSAGEHKRPEYLALNPMGKVPTLVHDGVVITETAAICCYLADAFPKAGLSVPIGDPRRGPYLKWLFFGPSCVEPAMIDRMFERPDAPSGPAGWGGYDIVLDVLSQGVQPGPYLLGEQFTAADVVIGAGLRWGMAFKGLPERPEYVAYANRLSERPALQRATALDKELADAAEKA